MRIYSPPRGLLRHCNREPIFYTIAIKHAKTMINSVSDSGRYYSPFQHLIPWVKEFRWYCTFPCLSQDANCWLVFLSIPCLFSLRHPGSQINSTGETHHSWHIEIVFGTYFNSKPCFISSSQVIIIEIKEQIYLLTKIIGCTNTALNIFHCFASMTKLVTYLDGIGPTVHSISRWFSPAPNLNTWVPHSENVWCTSSNSLP